MNIDNIVSETRLDFLDDSREPYLWSKEQLTRYANEAVAEACLRAPLLKRVKTLAITVGVADYVIDPYVRQIYNIKLDLVSIPLAQETDEGLSMQYGSQWKLRTGTPKHYIRSGKKLRLFPIPLVADTLSMSTSNIPDDDFDLEDDIDPAYHKSLMFWVAYKAFLFPDQDTYNPNKSANFLAMFNDRFGDAHTAKYDEVSFNMPTYADHSGGRMC